MQSADASDPGTHVRHTGELEQPLNGAVLAEQSVEDRQHDVDLAEKLPALRIPPVGTGRVSATGRSSSRAAPELSSHRPSRPIPIVWMS